MSNERTEIMNTRLRAHDGLLAASDLKPQEQVSVAMILVVLAMRRLFASLGIDGAEHGKKRKLIRNATEREFAEKLRTYTMPPVVTLANEEEPEPVAEASVVGA